jgi:hypothetical protein
VIKQRIDWWCNNPLLARFTSGLCGAGPVPPVTPDTDLGKSLKEALAKDVAPDKAKAVAQLVTIYDGLATKL